MLGAALREDLIGAGARLLAAADRWAAEPVAAAWLHDHALGEWRYYLASPLVDSIGPFAVYDRLRSAFERTDHPDHFSPRDIHLVSPNHPAAGLIGEAFAAGGTEPVFLPDAGVEGIGVDALVYRFEKAVLAGQAPVAVVPADQRVLSPEPA